MFVGTGGDRVRASVTVTIDRGAGTRAWSPWTAFIRRQSQCEDRWAGAAEGGPGQPQPGDSGAAQVGVGHVTHTYCIFCGSVPRHKALGKQKGCLQWEGVRQEVTVAF